MKEADIRDHHAVCVCVCVSTYWPIFTKFETSVMPIFYNQ